MRVMSVSPLTSTQRQWVFPFKDAWYLSAICAELASNATVLILAGLVARSPVYTRVPGGSPDLRRGFLFNLFFRISSF